MSSHPSSNTSELAPLISLGMVRTPYKTFAFARILLALMAFVAIVLIVTPWQQSARGEGRVIAYSPLERPQNIEAPIEGRVMRWYVTEGSWVEAGAPIVDISDNDPELITRLKQEKGANIKRLEATKTRVASIEARIESLASSRKAALLAAGQRIKMAGSRTVASERVVQASQAAYKTSRLNYERQKILGNKGLTSTRTIELAELDLVRAETDLERAKAGLMLAHSEQLAIESDRLKVEADTSAALDDARATLAAANGDVANATAELARIEVRLARQASQAVTAPRAGTILRLLVRQGSEMVKAGEPLAMFVPGGQRAVELWVSGNDAPLISAGRHVRLQFEGWPALQFSGWPSVAVGTFGGTVALVDASDDGKGKFRVVVVPTPQEPWPSSMYLRQGVRAHGWVMLGRVRLGYEVWRQFNGFPPTISSSEPTHADSKEKNNKSSK